MHKNKAIILLPLLLISLMSVGCSNKDNTEIESDTIISEDIINENENEEDRIEYLYDLSIDYCKKINEDNSNLVEIVQQYVLDIYNEETNLVKAPTIDEEGKFKLYLELKSNPNIKFEVYSYLDTENRKRFFTELDKEIASEIVRTKLEEHLKDLLPSNYKLYVSAKHDTLDTRQMDFNPFDIDKISSSELFKERNYAIELVKIGLYITDFDGDVEKYKELCKEISRISLEFNTYESTVVFADDLSYLNGLISYENNSKYGSVISNSEICHEVSFSTNMYIEDMHVYHDAAFKGFMDPLKDSVYGIFRLFTNEEEMYNKLCKDNTKLDSLLKHNKKYK